MFQSKPKDEHWENCSFKELETEAKLHSDDVGPPKPREWLWLVEINTNQQGTNQKQSSDLGSAKS